MLAIRAKTEWFVAVMVSDAPPPTSRTDVRLDQYVQLDNLLADPDRRHIYGDQNLAGSGLLQFKMLQLLDRAISGRDGDGEVIDADPGLDGGALELGRVGEALKAPLDLMKYAANADCSVRRSGSPVLPEDMPVSHSVAEEIRSSLANVTHPGRLELLKYLDQAEGKCAK